MNELNILSASLEKIKNYLEQNKDKESKVVSFNTPV